jgi:hypothetical protein
MVNPSSYGTLDLVRDVASRFTPSRPASFWDCGESLLLFLAHGGVERSLNEQLRRTVDDEHYAGDWFPNDVVLCRGEGWVLSVILLDVPRRYIHALPFNAMYVPLDESRLVGDRYLLPANYRNEVFDPAARLKPDGTVTARRGEILPLYTDTYAYDFHVTRPHAVLRLATMPLRPLEWLFSKATLQAWQANDADLGFTQLRVAANVLGKIAHQSSIGPLRQLATHPHHAVRWAAIQNLGRLNRSEALAKIRLAVNDPHPHVRRAAQKTLDALERRTTP